MYVYTLLVCLVFMKIGSRCWIPWSFSHRWMGATLWVLGTDPGSTAKTVSSLTTETSLFNNQPQHVSYWNIASNSLSLNCAFCISICPACSFPLHDGRQ